MFLLRFRKIMSDIHSPGSDPEFLSESESHPDKSLYFWYDYNIGM